jgi:hypothetical protein
MTDTRWAALAGVLFVVLFIGGLSLIGVSPETDAADSEWTEYLEDSGAHTRNIIGLYLWVIGGVLFVWFATHLRSVLRRADEGSDLAAFGYASAVIFAAMLLVSGAATATVPGAIEFGDTRSPGIDIAKLFPQMGYGVLLIGGGFAAIGAILSASIVILRTGALPQWLAWLGFVA